MTSYTLQKKWFAFWQNYRLKKQISTVAKLLLFIFVIWIIGSIFIILSQWLFAGEHQKTIYDYVKYFWSVIIMLVSGFDIPDSIHLHLVSRIISIFMLIMNLTVVAIFTGQIISMFNHVIKRADFFPQKPLQFKFKSPIIICGFNDKLKDIIIELRKDSSSWKREIVIVDEIADEIKKFDEEFENYNKDVWYVKGNPMDRKILEKALGMIENSAIILSEKDNNNKLSDTNAINTALAIETFKNVYSVLEINDPQNKFHFRRTKINEWICVEDFALKLISQCVLQNYIHRIFMNIMGGNSTIYAGNKISIIPITNLSVNKKTFFELKKDKNEIRENRILIGFVIKFKKDIINYFNLNLRNNQEFIQLNPTTRENIIHRTTKTRFEDEGIFQIDDQGAKKIVCSKQTLLGKGDHLIYISKINRAEQKKFKTKMYSEREEEIMTNYSENETKRSQEEIIKELIAKLAEKDHSTLSDHIIICNWNQKAITIIEELHDETVGNNMPIVIVTPDISRIKLTNSETFHNVFPVKGEPANDDVLRRANIDKAKTIIILADDQNLETADSQSILISLAVDTINPEAHLIVELVHSQNEKFFKYTHVDEIICLEQLAEKLLAQSALTPGLSRVYMDLLTQSSDTNEIYIEDVPEQLVGCKYNEAEEEIMSSNKDIILIGFSTKKVRLTHNGFDAHDKKGNILHGREIIINPSQEKYSDSKNDIGYSINYVLTQDDQLFMISYDKPYINFVLVLDKCKKSKEPAYLCLKNSDSIICGKINEIYSGSVEIAVTEEKTAVYKYKDIIDARNKPFKN